MAFRIANQLYELVRKSGFRFPEEEKESTGVCTFDVRMLAAELVAWELSEISLTDSEDSYVEEIVEEDSDSDAEDGAGELEVSKVALVLPESGTAGFFYGRRISWF